MRCVTAQCLRASPFTADLFAYIVTFNRRDFVGIEQFGLQTITPGQFLALPGDPSCSTISLRVPESLHRQARELAEQEGISIAQFRLVNQFRTKTFDLLQIVSFA